MGEITYGQNTATLPYLYEHLKKCDETFEPKLSSRVDLKEFAEKIWRDAISFDAWDNGKLIGTVDCYFNQEIAFITNVSVLPSRHGRGIAKRLMRDCLNFAAEKGFSKVRLEVNKQSKPAVDLYTKFGFYMFRADTQKDFMTMEVNVKKRDYNEEFKDTENHKYAYGFDFDVMHPYMIKTFSPYVNAMGSALELGSFEGAFTKRLSDRFRFDGLTCVEASDKAIKKAKTVVSNAIYHNALFEEVKLPEQYDNIFMTHVLEHIDDPWKVLSNVKDWLTPRGRFFLACPNAFAASRQIAVKMGLITHPEDITPDEKTHGHRRTYSLETLEGTARKAGLKVIHRGGIFFKALANFQWDKLLKTDIISKEYLEGCYELGKQYPDLCSSIFLVCEKGDS